MADRRWDIRYYGPSGREWRMSSHDWNAGLKAGGFSGLVGQLSVSAVRSIGESGQRVESYQVPPADGYLDVFARADGGLTATDAWVALRQDFKRRAPFGTLVVGSPLGLASARVRLSGELPPPDVDDVMAAEKPLRVPLSNDDGVWWLEAQSFPDTVTVTNFGDVTVWPEIVWNGAGGVVKLPSGASFNLPAVKNKHLISLHPKRTRKVLDAAGGFDDDVYKQLRGVILPEGVATGGSGVFTVPTGAELRWKVGVLDPWL
ncbi:hypothetical protein FRC0497_01453 [Corynebacterium diphtheriae]|nr:hypothetical protein FRC0497_01453 [Corynebacterium diphtheriae]